jgi:hypothetical protein
MTDRRKQPRQLRRWLVNLEPLTQKLLLPRLPRGLGLGRQKRHRSKKLAAAKAAARRRARR